MSLSIPWSQNFFISVSIEKHHLQTEAYALGQPSHEGFLLMGKVWAAGNTVFGGG